MRPRPHPKFDKKVIKKVHEARQWSSKELQLLQGAVITQDHLVLPSVMIRGGHEGTLFARPLLTRDASGNFRISRRLLDNFVALVASYPRNQRLGYIGRDRLHARLFHPDMKMMRAERFWQDFDAIPDPFQHKAIEKETRLQHHQQRRAPLDKQQQPIQPRKLPRHTKQATKSRMNKNEKSHKPDDADIIFIGRKLAPKSKEADISSEPNEAWADEAEEQEPEISWMILLRSPVATSTTPHPRPATGVETDEEPNVQCDAEDSEIFVDKVDDKEPPVAMNEDTIDMQ
ncbi:hypothetical protein QR680_003136 [Steinernema hermaphroditum]|uniref:Uncharacterized protein n=1 Tax=Steinernema hermaphroditum TaxID=289476 RepID=A0AA39H5H4_9BILA|nr:hypothetical protein QR680_003136 [Steinernema hermaphroditum]